jgi:hypothetical protein
MVKWNRGEGDCIYSRGKLSAETVKENSEVRVNGISVFIFVPTIQKTHLHVNDLLYTNSTL